MIQTTIDSVGASSLAGGNSKARRHYWILAIATCSLLGTIPGRLAAQVAAPASLEQEAPGVATEETQPAGSPAAETPAAPPWTRSAQPPPRPTTQSVTAKEMLRMYGIDQSQLDRLFDQRALDADEHETLFKILFRMPYFRRSDTHRWSQQAADWSAVVAAPAEHRAEFFHLEGRVKRALAKTVPPETAVLLGFQEYFEVTVDAKDDSQTFVLCARTIPDRWPIDEPLDEPTRLEAMFLKVGEVAAERTQLVFAVDRVPWFPDRVETRWGVEPAHLVLAKLGVDFSLLEDLKRRNRKRFDESEAEAFYQMMKAGSEFEALKEPSLTARKLELAPILLKPEEQHGRYFAFRGVVSRITTVEVPDEIKQRLGFDHYYQLEFFFPLQGQEVRLGKTNGDDGEMPVISNEFPFVCCAVELPEALRPPGAGVSEDGVNHAVRLTGIFYRLWIYQSEFLSSFDQQQRQISPMFMVSRLEVVDRPAQNPLLGLAGGLAFLLVLGAIWWGLWRYNRGDRVFEKTTLDKQFEVQPGQSLDELGIDASDRPDFRNLD